MGRKLGLAGRVTYLDRQHVQKSSLVGKTVGMIPYLAVHLDGTQKDKIEINSQDHLPVVCWLNSSQKTSEIPL